MQPYDKHTSRVKSWNYVNFLLESHLNSLDLDLGIIEPCNLFLVEVREIQGTWVPKSQGEWGNVAKKIRWKPWRVVTNFCRNCSRKSLFTMSKLTNLKNSGRGVFKKVYISKPPLSVQFFWYSPYSGKEEGSDLHVLHQAIKIRVT